MPAGQLLLAGGAPSLRTFPRRVPLGLGHCRLPDRGGLGRGREGAEHLGHLQPGPGQHRGRVGRQGGLRQLPQVPRGCRDHEGARAQLVQILHILAEDSAGR